MSRWGALLAALLTFAAVSAHAADPALSDKANAAFLAANAAKPGVATRPSGLQYRILRNGFGARPAAVDKVTVNYRGSLINGTVFDSTEPGMPVQFTVNQLIPGWTEALELMREGDHWEIVVPAELAYGSRGAGGGAIPPNQVLVFDMELVKVTPAPPKKPGEDDDDKSSGGGSG